jgi:hypothetical protein
MKPVLVKKGSPPSSYAIADLVDGKPGSLGRTVSLTAQRAAFIVPGLYVAGIRWPKLATGAIYGSIGITLWILGLYSLKKPK